MKNSKLNNLKKNRNFLAANKGTMDAKLSQAALLLEYTFGFKVDFKNRVILLSGEIDQEMFEIVEAGLTEMESQSRSTVTIKINSPGGEVYQALAIVGRLKKSKCKIITEGYGHIMSAATLVLACGDERKISKYAFFMHHETSYGIEGKHSELKAEVMQAEREEQCWAQWMEEWSQKPKKFWTDNGRTKNAYFSPDQLLKFGVVDEIF